MRRHENSQLIQAAGGVPWRSPDGVTVEVALVHRPVYEAWSLPRTKVSAGEHPLVTACREVAEETGAQVSAGRRLEMRHYDTAAGPKAVEYWAVQGPEAWSTPTAEMDGLIWLPLADARRWVYYRNDGWAIDALEPLPPAALVAGVLLVCNGQAVARRQWTGGDGDRPLDRVGQRQARDLSRALPSFGPSELLSACGARFGETVRPLGAELGLTVASEPEFGEDEYARHPGRVQSRIMELACGEGGPAVVCASGAVIRHLLATLAAYAELVPGEFPAVPGSVYALFFVGGQLAAADYYPALVSP